MVLPSRLRGELSGSGREARACWLGGTAGLHPEDDALEGKRHVRKDLWVPRSCLSSGSAARTRRQDSAGRGEHLVVRRSLERVTDRSRPRLALAGSSAPQVLAGLDDAGGHGRLGGLAPRAWVVDLLVADLAVDLEHAVVVLEHVVGDRPGEG